MRNVQEWRDGFMVQAGAAGVSPHGARAIVRTCQRWNTACERACSEDLPEEWQDREEERHMAACAKWLPDGYTVETEGDPRGWTTLFRSPEEHGGDGLPRWGW